MKTAILVDGGFYRKRAQSIFGVKSSVERAEEQAHYTIDPKVIKKLCNGSRTFDELREEDFRLKVDQKGVDMKIGIDIASMAYKGQVDKMVLISGDSDFVPAAKLARREGIDFVLDPMGAPIKPELFEHIDGLRSCDASIHNN